MVKKQKNEATTVASSRSSPRSRGQVEEDKIKEQLTAELPEWARDLPEYIIIREYTIN